MDYCFADFETRSAIDIKKSGAFRYVEDESFDVLLLAYAFDDGPVQVVDFTQGETWPEEFLQALRDPSVTKVAHNAIFERTVIGKLLGYTPPEEWLDTMHLAAQCGLPLSLDAAGKALGLPEDQAKMREGKALIRYFCQPCKPIKANGGRTWNLPEHAPEKWDTFKAYCQRDVEVERTIFHTLERWMPSPEERRFWCLDARINERGVRIDRRMAQFAVAMDQRYKEELTAKAVALTGLENPKSVSQVKTWLADQEGKEFPSLNKKVVADVVASLTSDASREFMALRSELSKSSTAKYEAMLRAACADDHVRGTFQFYGANRTGRMAGRLLQLQNLPQNHMEDLDEARQLVLGGHYTALKVLYDGVSQPLSELIRTALIPEPGHQFLVADFSAIEARVIAWMAGERWRLDAFREGADIYCASASQAFHVPVVKHGINGHLRQKGKIMELACIAEDELVLTDTGLVPIQDVTTDMKLWDGEEWVSHDGVVCKGEKEVITYGGLTATPNHLVWVEGCKNPFPFGYAASLHLELLHLEDSTAFTKRDCFYDSVRVYDILNARPRHRFTVSNVLVHNCGYGGGIGAMKAFGADKLGMTEDEMQETVDLWRESSPRICEFWRSLEKAAIRSVVRRAHTVSEIGGIGFDMEQGVLWMTLPSGRRIAYWGARYEESHRNAGRKVLSYMGQNQQTKKWERIETWGGKLVENCWAAGTPVLTHRGWVPIEDVSGADLVWDGVEWVPTNGSAVRYSRRPLFELDGLCVTGEHKILTERGWVNAADCDGLDRVQVQLPGDSGPQYGHGFSWAPEVECQVRMRKCTPRGYQGCPAQGEAGTTCVLWLQNEGAYRCGPTDTRNVEAPGLRCVALHGAALYRADAPSLEKLRWAWHHGLRSVAAQLREFLGRHGPNLFPWFGAGSKGKRKGVFPRELPLGDTKAEHPQSAKIQVCRVQGAEGECFGTGRETGDKLHHTPVSAGTRLSCRSSGRCSGREEPVYDVLNCGPRHRYVVLGKSGPIIAHNCVQATARDCLREAMFALDAAGFDIRATVHDEVIVTEPIGGRSAEEMAALMGGPIPWAPGLPLRADGYACPYYQKD